MTRHLEYPDCSLYGQIAKTAKAYPDSCALSYYGRRITYRKLMEMIDRCGEALSSLHIQKGDSVAVILPNMPQTVIVFYALNKLGAVANMIHPLSARGEIEYYLQLSGSKVILALDGIAEKLEGLSADTIIIVSPDSFMPLPLRIAYRIRIEREPHDRMDWHALMQQPGAPVTDMGKGADGAAVLYTGGTTGKPKGILLTNLNFNALALQSMDACGCLLPGDRVLSVMPMFHGFGLGVCIHTVLTFGGTAILLPRFHPKEFHRLIARYRPNVIAGVPSIYEYLLRSDLGKLKLDFLKVAISGGDSLAVSTKRQFDRILRQHGSSARIREGYGLTECVTGSCLMPQESEKEGSIGLPYADTEYQIYDNQHQTALPPGELGEIILRGPTVMQGYLQNPEETARALQTHADGHTWLHTGDLGCMDADGYIYFKQRCKRVIVSNGYSIYPQAIENAILSCPEVSACAVVGVQDPIRGQLVQAFVVLKEHAATEQTEQALREICREQVAAYALPRKYVFLEALPKTLVGKIAYSQLEAMGSEEEDT